jgi:uncharacterized protein
MRWRESRRSENVEDDRGAGLPGGLGRVMLPRGVGRTAGIGGVGMVVLILLALFFGIDPSALVFQDATFPDNSQTVAPSSPGDAQMRDFVSAVLGETEDTWTEVFRANGLAYQPPRLVLFSDAVQSACGFAQSAVGPFYCPENQKVYLDLSFFDDLERRLGAPGDFAEAYVIAHEVGHHVQNLLGIMDKVDRVRMGATREDGNALSVMLELQADCFAGVWANRAEQRRHVLEPGDVEEAMTAAAAVGDDRLQRRGQGYVVPESFTHGTSKQRMTWFKRGFDSGSIGACDTFSASAL